LHVSQLTCAVKQPEPMPLCLTVAESVSSERFSEWKPFLEFSALLKLTSEARVGSSLTESFCYETPGSSEETSLPVVVDMKAAPGSLMVVCLLPPAVERGIDALLPAAVAPPLVVPAAVFALTPAGALVVVVPAAVFALTPAGALVVVAVA